MPGLPHIHLRNLSPEGIAFRPYSGGSKKVPEVISDRGEHAERLKESVTEIEGVMAQFQEVQKSVGLPKNKRGIIVSATGIGAQDLWLGDMKSSSPGISLLTARFAAAQNPASARLFVTQESLKTLSRQLDEYGAYEVKPTNKKPDKRPQRFTLFESLSELRPASIEDVWSGPLQKIPGTKSERVEAWIRTDRAEYFYRMLEAMKVKHVGNPTKFADSTILDIDLNGAQLDKLLHATAAVIEFRPSSHFVTDYRRSSAEQRKQVSDKIAQRIVPAAGAAPRTVILDSGVSTTNPLLKGSLPPEFVRTVEKSWGLNDHSGHGSNMAGVALFPNLGAAAEGTGPIRLSTALESVKIVRPLSSTTLVSPREAIEKAVELVERDGDGRRVYSLSATVPGEDEDGRQSATSAAIDKLAWNKGQKTRLFCVAAGNVEATPQKPYVVADYQNRNEKFPVQSPAQAVNALSVGAFTDKSARYGRTVAPAGDLCPVSRTSQGWPSKQRSSNKPDVVFEGGNHLIDPGDKTSRSVPDTRVMTTGPNESTEIDFTGETSAATAGVSGIATRLLARYPGMRAETIRGLIVNGAAWTDAMQAQASGGHDARRRVLDRFGWGVPNEQRIQESAANSLTLVVEDELVPFETRDGRGALKEMKYFDLPWPTAELARLGNEEVQLVCTLSYFVEPDPLADKRARRDRYASHRLRFRFNQPGDTAASAQSRLNQLVELEEGDLAIPSWEDGNWTVEWRRADIGSVHQNIWTGPAHELAARGGVSVYPVKGWWAERKSPEYRRPTPFSLIISVRTQRTDVDLYAAASANVPAHAIVVSAPT